MTVVPDHGFGGCDRGLDDRVHLGIPDVGVALVRRYGYFVRGRRGVIVEYSGRHIIRVLVVVEDGIVEIGLGHSRCRYVLAGFLLGI